MRVLWMTMLVFTLTQVASIAHSEPPNPAGQSLLQKYFPDGIAPGKLFLAALQTLGGDGDEEDQQDCQHIHVADHPPVARGAFCLQVLWPQVGHASAPPHLPPGWTLLSPPLPSLAGSSVAAAARAMDGSCRKGKARLP